MVLTSFIEKPRLELISLVQVPQLVNIRTTIVFNRTGGYSHACGLLLCNMQLDFALLQSLSLLNLGASLYCTDANKAASPPEKKEDLLLSPSGNHYLACVISYLAWMSPSSTWHLLPPVTLGLPSHL